jgi:pimeloyl-ACP methyl ester carboxylesterase
MTRATVATLLLAIVCAVAAPASVAATRTADASRSPTAPVEAPPAYTRAVAGDVEHLQFVQVNGVRLAYRLAGAGTPVVFVHGEGYSHELWTKQLDAFAAKHLAIVYDRRGHGMSDDPITGYSETAHAEDLNALLMHFGIREAHFVANSRGGAIIVQFLKLYPQKVRSVTFADATIALAPITPDSAFYNAPKAMAGPAPTLEQALAGREAAKKSSFTRVAQARPELAAIQRRMADQFSPRVAMNPQRSDSASPMHIGPWNVRDFPDMAQMAQPMLLLTGELTDPFFIAGAKEAHRLWPNTRLHTIPGTDHLLMLEDPATFNRRVLDFLDEVDAQVAGREQWVRQVPVR